MNGILDLLTDYTFLMIALGSGLLGLLSGIMGVYVTVRKQGLICDAISHSTLPGVCIAFMVLGIKNLEFLLLGAFIAGVIAALFIFGIDLKSTHKYDMVPISCIKNTICIFPFALQSAAWCGILEPYKNGVLWEQSPDTGHPAGE